MMTIPLGIVEMVNITVMNTRVTIKLFSLIYFRRDIEMRLFIVRSSLIFFFLLDVLPMEAKEGNDGAFCLIIGSKKVNFLGALSSIVNTVGGITLQNENYWI